MKDRQSAAAANSNGMNLGLILVSPLLHCVSMTVLVYLRSGFGFAFLRPKSVFFACSWAFLLYATYAWIDGETWQEHRLLLWYGLGAMALYWLHLSVTLRREWREESEHDHFSGVSHLSRLSGWMATIGVEQLHLWIEPLVVVAVALSIRVASGKRYLSGWLLVAAVCLWSKELLNRWLGLRQRKRHKDVLEDAEDAFKEQSSTGTAMIDPAKAGSRKPKVRRARQSGCSSQSP